MKPYALAAGAAVSILLASCSSSSQTAGSGSTPSSAATPTSSAETTTSAGGGAPQSAAGIVISGFAYSGSMKVKPGEKVTVTNKDTAAHTLTDTASHKFDTGNISGNGGTGSFTAPSKPGSYPFGCTYHKKMAGTLIVS